MRIADPENTVDQQLELLRFIREYGPQTRRELSEKSGYSVSLIRQLTQNLLEHALLVEDSIAAQSTPGRPSQRWGLAPDACIAVGLDVGGSYTRLVVLDTAGRILHKQTVETLQAEKGEVLLAYLAQLVEAELSALNLERGKVAGLGVAFSGFIDYKHGQSIDAPNIASSRQLPLQANLETALNLRVMVEDSSRTMALAEMRYGQGRSTDNFVCVNVGAGIGMGIIADRQLQRGVGLAGELGHIPMQIYGERCRCGGQGCLETLASGSAIAAKARYMLEQHVPTVLHDATDNQPAAVNARLVTEAALNGDKLALDLLRDAGMWLGVGIATVISLFSPEKVVLTGGVTRRNELLLGIVQAAAERYTLPQVPRPLPIMLTSLDEHVAALGAATLILDEAFTTGFAERLSAVLS